MQRSKTYRAAADTFDKDELHAPLAAIKIAKTTSKKKFDETVDVVMRLGVDPRKADQMVRGTVNLPHGTGKTAKVLVFANGDKAEAAREAGADVVGGDELIEKVAGGWLDFDAVVATPDMMGKVGRLGRVLGPRGLMPNPKTGTVTPDVAKAVTDIKGGKIEFRVDRHANLHFIIGKASFSETQLAENYASALDEVLRLKPASSKGRYIRKVTVSTTMGPGVQVDPNRTKNVASRTRTPRPEAAARHVGPSTRQGGGPSSSPAGVAGWAHALRDPRRLPGRRDVVRRLVGARRRHGRRRCATTSDDEDVLAELLDGAEIAGRDARAHPTDPQRCSAGCPTLRLVVTTGMRNAVDRPRRVPRLRGDRLRHRFAGRHRRSS